MKILFKAKFPVPGHGIKKNNKQIAMNRRTGQRFIRTNDKAKFLEEWLIKKLIAEKLKQRLDTITTPINAKFIFYFPKTQYFTKKNERSKKLPDLSNLYETIQDALQKANVIENDTLIDSHDGSRREPIDDVTAWLEIEITESIG